MNGVMAACFAAVSAPLIFATLRAASRWVIPTTKLVKARCGDDNESDIERRRPAMDQDDEQFLGVVATQINWHIPKREGESRHSLSALESIIVRIFLDNADMDSMIESTHHWSLGVFARMQLRRLIAASAILEGERPTESMIDGMHEWLRNADRGVLSRLRMIAESRRR